MPLGCNGGGQKPTEFHFAAFSDANGYPLGKSGESIVHEFRRQGNAAYWGGGTGPGSDRLLAIAYLPAIILPCFCPQVVMVRERKIGSRLQQDV